MALFSPKAFDLILSFEGLGQPGHWPGGDSGVTIGFGYDLAYVSVDQFASDWIDHLDGDVFSRLEEAIGLKGTDAKLKATEFTDIIILRADALEVFRDRTIPLFQAKTAGAFPGLESLPLDAQGALVSLVYNRGTSTEGDRRREMRAIRDAVARGDLQDIANQLRAMKRLWVGKGLPGLLRRREAEAELVESCIIQT